MGGSQNFFHGALGWDDWIWWSAIGAVALFLLMLMLCCCVCMRRAKTKGRREAIAQANVRRREREQRQRQEQQYAQARQQQQQREREASQFKYSKPEPPMAQAQPYVPQQQQQQQYGQPPQQYQPQYPPQYGQQSPQQYGQYQQQQAPPPYNADAYQQPPPYNPDTFQQPQQPKYYPPPASPPPARPVYEDAANTTSTLPPTRQMYNEGGTAARYTSGSTGSADERASSSPARRYQNRSYTQPHPDQPPLLQYGRKNSRANSHLASTSISTQDTFNNPDAVNDVPFVNVTSPTGIPLGEYAPPRDSNNSLPTRSSTQSKASNRSRGQTLQERIEALRTGGVQDNHTRISVESPHHSNMAVASTGTSSATTTTSPTRSGSGSGSGHKSEQSLFQRQLAASSDLDDSFVSGDSSGFGSSYASTEAGQQQRGILTPREDVPQRRQANGSLDSRESVEF